MIKKLKNWWLSSGLKGHKTIILAGSLAALVPTLTSNVSHAGTSMGAVTCMLQTRRRCTWCHFGSQDGMWLDINKYQPSRTPYNVQEALGRVDLTVKVGLSTAPPFSPASSLASCWLLTRLTLAEGGENITISCSCNCHLPTLVLPKLIKMKAKQGLPPHTGFTARGKATAQCYFERFRRKENFSNVFTSNERRESALS